MKIALVGGGNLGHAIAATASLEGADVCVLTSHSAKWSKKLEVRFPSGKTLASANITCCENPREAIADADIILLTVPSHLIASALRRIEDWIVPGQLIGSVVASGGFFWISRHLLGKEIGLFAFHRVPFICRVRDPGRVVDITGLKKELFLAQSGISSRDDHFWAMLELFTRCFLCRINVLDSFLEVTISNSNPILHTSRLFSLLSADVIEEPLYFYRDWDAAASRILLACDEEIVQMLKKLGLRFPLYKTLKEHYDVENAGELTRKLSSIAAFEGITFPVIEDGAGKRHLDPSSRYFHEDLPFGIVVLRALAEMVGVLTPHMDAIICKLQGYLGREYLDRDGKLKGRDILDTGVPQNFGINTLEALIAL